jgi:transmembrane sensor
MYLLMVLYSMTEQYIEALVQKYADGTATPEEVQQLMNWYRAAPVGDVAWLSSDVEEKEKVYQRMLQRLQATPLLKRGRLYWLTPLRTAAMVLIVLGAAMLFYFWPSESIAYTTVTNPSGRIQQVKLPDGSMVWLNAATTLRYAKSFTQHRQLQLDGEAYFEVAHDSTHPFTVKSGDIAITVLGTRFNIWGYASGNRTTVSLLAGKVSVAAAEKEMAVLSPSTQLEWDRQAKKATIKTIETAAVVAWKAGKLQFQGQTLSEIMQTLERWYGVRIHITSTDLSQCRYYMNFNSAMPLKDVLALMSEITKMNYALDKQTIVISGNGCE